MSKSGKSFMLGVAVGVAVHYFYNQSRTHSG